MKNSSQGVYTSTELYMTQDQSPDFEATREFLDRRLQDTAYLGKTMGQMNGILNLGLKSLQSRLFSNGFKRD